MGFEPQTAGKPLVEVHKKSTKVNISVAIGVVIFLLVGVGVVVWAVQKEAHGQAVKTQVESPR